MVRRIALLLLSLLVVSGCVWGDPIPRAFRVTNSTHQTILVSPVNSPNKPEPILAGRTAELQTSLEDCSSRPWVATNEVGEVLAQIPGGCLDHYWTIRGLNDSSYE
jgi:hypothetical protein